jgi:hypothetical protein
VLVAVGAGEEVVGAGAGLVAGGARVWLAATLWLGDGAGALADCGDGVGLGREPAWVAGWVAGCVADRVPAMPCGFVPACPAAGGGAAAVVDGPAGGAGATLAAGAGAVRANTIAKPTVASAPS